MRAFELPWDARFTAGARQLLHGRSWSGARADPVRRREHARPAPRAPARAAGGDPWVRWVLPRTPPARGAYEPQARATDASGSAQPSSVPVNDGGYQFWVVVRHPVTAV